MAKEFELLSKNYEEMKVLPAAAAAAGELVTYNEVNGFHFVDFSAEQVAAGEEATLITNADTVKVIKAAGQAWVAGEAVAFVVASSHVSNVLTSNILVGHAKEAALTAAVEGFIQFDGMLAFAKL